MSELKVTKELQRYLESIINQKINQALQQRKDAVMTEEQKEFSDKRKGYFKTLRDSLLSVVYSKPSLTQLWAETGSVTAPSLPQQSAGWNSSLPPTTYTFNFLQQIVEQYLLHINQQGICVWDGLTDYPISGLSKGSDGNIYRGLTTPNVGNDPTTDAGVHWFLITGENGAGVAHVAQVEFIATGIDYAPFSTAIFPWDTIDRDDFGLWNTSTYTFTLDQAGYWDIGVTVINDNTGLSVHSTFNVNILVNGSIYRQIITDAEFATPSTITPSATFERYCALNDTIQTQITTGATNARIKGVQFWVRFVGTQRTLSKDKDVK